jgi:uncharacterized protein YcbK (DUF882 family)
LFVGIARVSGYVKPTFHEPALSTVALSQLQRASALHATMAAALDWSKETNRAIYDITTPPEEVVPVRFFDVNRKVERVFELTLDGNLRGDATEDEFKHFFRCRRSDREHEMDPRVLRIVADLSKHYKGKTIEVVSAFRKKGFGAKHSKHYEGRAIDLKVRGVPTHKVRDYIWTKYQDVGVGHYLDQQFLHVDFRPASERIAWTQRHENSPNTYNPKWARTAVPEVTMPGEEDDHGEIDLFANEPPDVTSSAGAVAIVAAAAVPAPAAAPIPTPAPVEKKLEAPKREEKLVAKAKKKKRTSDRQKVLGLPPASLADSTPKAPW